MTVFGIRLAKTARLVAISLRRDSQFETHCVANCAGATVSICCERALSAGGHRERSSSALRTRAASVKPASEVCVVWWLSVFHAAHAQWVSIWLTKCDLLHSLCQSYSEKGCSHGRPRQIELFTITIQARSTSYAGAFARPFVLPVFDVQSKSRCTGYRFRRDWQRNR